MEPASLTTDTFLVLVRDDLVDVLVPGMVQVEPDGRAASFVPDAPYGVNRKHTVTLTSAITDRAGNTLPSHGFVFKTAFQEDTERPSLVGVSPPDGAIDVPINAVIVVEFDELVSSFGVLAGFSVAEGGEFVAGSIALSNANRKVTFTPASSLASWTLAPAGRRASSAHR